MMSATELQKALKDLLKFEMSPEEVKTMHEFFRAKFKRSEVRKAEFAELINKQTVRKYEPKEAKSALAAIKGQLQKDGRTIEAALGNADSSYPGEISIRGFKLAIFSLGCLNQQQINNLAKYMDRHNNGMIKISDVHMAVYSDKYDPKTLSK